MIQRKKYAQVGLGSRSGMYSYALVDLYAETSELVGLCDSNPGRLENRLEFARQDGDRKMLLDAAIDLCNMCLLQGNYAEAERVARQALEQARTWQFSWDEIKFLEKLAEAAQGRQDWPAAQDWLAQALEEDRRTMAAEVERAMARCWKRSMKEETK